MQRPDGVVNLAGSMIDARVPAHSQTRGNLGAFGQLPPSIAKPQVRHVERGNPTRCRINVIDAILRINLYIMDLVRLAGRHRPRLVKLRACHGSMPIQSVGSVSKYSSSIVCPISALLIS